MFTFKVREYTEIFGDKQCIDYMVDLLKRNGAPKEKCTVDFAGAQIADGSMVFIAEALTALNAEYANLPKNEKAILERFKVYKPLNNVPFSQFKHKLNLKIGEFVILTRNMFTKREEQTLARVEAIEARSVRVREYARAHFSMESEKLISTVHNYDFLMLHEGDPSIRRPTKKENEFIENVLRYHASKKR